MRRMPVEVARGMRSGHVERRGLEGRIDFAIQSVQKKPVTTANTFISKRNIINNNSPTSIKTKQNETKQK